MEQRNRGIDLLRMTAMWMVVILHILNKGGVLAAAAPLSAGQGTARLLETAAYCAVNCYGLISGYVGVQRRFRYSGALALWLRVAFYTLGITAVFACLMPGSVNGDRVLRAFFPVLFRQYWYVTAYFGMCLFIPFFNLLLNRLSKGQLRLLALSIVLAGLIAAVYGVIAWRRQEGFGMYFTLLGLAVVFLFSGTQVIPTMKNNKRAVTAAWEQAQKDMAGVLPEHFPLPARYAHPVVLDRMIRVLREGRAQNAEEALAVVKADLKALNADVQVSQEEYDEVVAIKPMFLNAEYQ